MRIYPAIFFAAVFLGALMCLALVALYAAVYRIVQAVRRCPPCWEVSAHRLPLAIGGVASGSVALSVVAFPDWWLS